MRPVSLTVVPSHNAAGEEATARPFIAECDAMRSVLATVARIAGNDAPVLVTGETGTGKGIIARAVHAASPRASRPFVSVNCAALPEPLLEMELFGSGKPAHPGGAPTRRGLFVEAQGGTLFLDEIGDLSAGIQAKLLHVLERAVVRPSGEKDPAPDVRLVTATHKNLHRAAEQGTFREDLLFRLDVMSIELPALRDRGADFTALAELAFKAAKARHPSSPVVEIGDEAMERLRAHRWPGNIRELEAVIERLVAVGNRSVVGVDDLPVRLVRPAPAPPFGGDVIPIRTLQHLYARWALAELGGVRKRTAERLGVDVKTLAKWLAYDG